MNDTSKKLTIVLVLKDRAPFTWRWMKYYNKVGLPFKVLIADGGKDPSVEKLKDKSLFNNIDYEYVRYPYDKDIPTFLKKLHDTVSMIKTKYAILVDNDDFHLVEPLSKAVEFLEENSDYMAACGEIYDFRVKPTDTSNENDDVYGKMTNVSKILSGHSNTNNTALGRIRFFSEYSADLAHDVVRTEKLKHCCQILVDSNITDLQLSDNLMDYLLVTCGKTYKGKGLYMLHQSHLGGLGRVLLNTDPFDWIMSELWLKDIPIMYSAIAKEISNLDRIPFSDVYNKVMQYYTCFIIGKNIIKGRTERKISQKPSKIVTWGRIFNKNNPVRIFLKKTYLYIQKYKEKRRSNRLIASSPYRQDFEEIMEFLYNK